MTEEERDIFNILIKKKQDEKRRGETEILLEGFRPKRERARTRKDSSKEKNGLYHT